MNMHDVYSPCTLDDICLSVCVGLLTSELINILHIPCSGLILFSFLLLFSMFVFCVYVIMFGVPELWW